MAFEPESVATNAGASGGLNLSKPIAGALVAGVGSMLYGFSSGDALRCAAAGGLSAWGGEMLGNWVLPAEADLRGMARSWARQGVDAAATGGLFVYAKPMIGVSRPLSIAGQSQKVSTFIAGAGISVGGDLAQPMVAQWWGY